MNTNSNDTMPPNENISNELAVPDNNKSNKQSNKKSNKKSKSKKSLGSEKGIETLLRNAYRAHLDLISLVATKANIMISINGLILSFLFISEAFILSAEPLLEIPTMIFLITCFLAMVFSILSALPIRRKKEWVSEDFEQERANLLLYEDYTALDDSQYMQSMKKMLQKREQVYGSMIRQLYFLGSHTNKRQNLLGIAYRIFLIGLGMSVASSLVVLSIVSFSNEKTHEEKTSEAVATTTSDSTIKSNKFEPQMRFDSFLNMDNIFEPSGVVQLHDGRLIVIEDEPKRPFSFVTLNTSGDMTISTPSRESLLKGRDGLRALGKLSDLEGVTADKDGFVYAVTSHSRTEKKGRASPVREKLVRFQVDQDNIINPGMIEGFKNYLVEDYPEIEQLSKEQSLGLNIEGLGLSQSQEQLIVGFRSPLENDQAIIISIDNYREIFTGEKPRIDKVLLDLDGAGIRSICYFEPLKGYLILARNEQKKKQPFELWYWNGKTDGPAFRVAIAGIENLRRAEAIAPVRFNNNSAILILSDEGNPRKDKPGKYILVRYDQLTILPNIS